MPLNLIKFNDFVDAPERVVGCRYALAELFGIEQTEFGAVFTGGVHIDSPYAPFRSTINRYCRRKSGFLEVPY
jgi:hypothetical protein